MKKLFVLNVLGGIAARIAWVSEDGSLAAMAGMSAALVWFIDFALVIQRWGMTPTRTDYLAMSERYPEKHVATGQFTGSRRLTIAPASKSVWLKKGNRAS